MERLFASSKSWPKDKFSVNPSLLFVNIDARSARSSPRGRLKEALNFRKS